MNVSGRQYQVRSRMIETYCMYTLLPCTTQVSSYIVAMESLYTLQYHLPHSSITPQLMQTKNGHVIKHKCWFLSLVLNSAAPGLPLHYLC